MDNDIITIEQTITAPLQKAWTYWTQPEHITQWNAASDDWYAPRAESDLRPGGRFFYRMEARDGSVGFDFEGVYDTVTPQQSLEYTLGDGRKAWIEFREEEGRTTIVERFEAEGTHPAEMQQQGWQAILDNYKKYTESQ